MTEEREELKGKLLTLWLEDLKKDKEPGRYPEMEALTQEEREELMGLARFIKATFYPTEALPADISSYAKNLSAATLRDWAKQSELAKSALKKAGSFGDLVRQMTQALGINKAALEETLAVPRSTFSELEEGKMPPHRLPANTMVALLYALRLGTKEVVNLIRRSSLEWANKTHASGPTQLGRVDFSLKSEERQELMQGQPDLASELERIERYCSTLSKSLA